MAMTTKSKTRRTNKTRGSARKRRGKGRSLGLRFDDSVQLVGSVQAGFEFDKLLAFHKFGHQGASQETGCACYYCGHDSPLTPE